MRPTFATAEAYAEGSPVDRLVFLGLIVAGVVVLARRQINWSALTRANALLVAYFAYCLLSVLWSDDPFVGFKRWFKDLGNPIMALVVLTTPNPVQALASILRRLAFVLLPLSVLFIKYYPELGRAYHYDGSPMYTGVGHQKNDLGLMCLVTGMYFLWQLMVDKARFAEWTPTSRLSAYSLMAMLLWLLYMSNSQTSLACLVTVGVVLLCYRLPYIRRSPSRLIGLLVGGVLTYFLLDGMFDLRARVFEILGRDATLTNRTDIWEVALRLADDNPFLGSGFMSFWTVERMVEMTRYLGTSVNQAHNGYIEQYLNLGFIGVGFVVLLVGRTLWRIRAQLPLDPPMAIMRLCFVIVALLYNYTEASFYGVSNMWVLTLLAWIQVPSGSLADATVAEASSMRRDRSDLSIHSSASTSTRAFGRDYQRTR